MQVFLRKSKTCSYRMEEYRWIIPPSSSLTWVLTRLAQSRNLFVSLPTSRVGWGPKLSPVMTHHHRSPRSLVSHAHSRPDGKGTKVRIRLRGPVTHNKARNQSDFRVSMITALTACWSLRTGIAEFLS